MQSNSAKTKTKSFDAGEKSRKTKYNTLLKISVPFPFNALIKEKTF